MLPFKLFLSALPLLLLSWTTPSTAAENIPPTSPESEKIGGVSVVSPSRRVTDQWVDPVRRMNAEWVAILPYAFSSPNSPRVNYNLSRQWWGERFEGMTEIIRHAKGKGVKVLLKPMVWVPGSWPGDYALNSEEKWQEWEANYSRYILEAAAIAAREGVDMFCVGTEYKKAVVERERFWRDLIAQIRKVFKGPLTYAANWDNCMKVPFWKELDYIGVDAYFPLSPAPTAEVATLKRKWSEPMQKVRLLNKIYRKKILFTEFGYRSTDACTWNQWEIQNIPYSRKVNLQAQVNAYRAFFESFWDKDWFAGVFLWQWYTNHASAGGEDNSDYTPQNKPAEKVIREWFSKGAG
ncbi:MAG: hypothetical protein AAGN35_27320 [Bacteroidota bacterium]